MHQIYISVGSNIERDKHTRAGLDALHQCFGPLTLSSVYESEAVGFSGSHFYNLAVGAKTHLNVQQVCEKLKTIEANNGRVRGEKKFAPRTLDLDLLMYDNLVTQEGVDLPRAEIEFNAFVLRPLSEIAAETIHPIRQVSIGQLWNAYDKTAQQLWAIDFNWSPISS